LRRFAAEYIRDRSIAGDLKSKLIAIAHDRSTGTERRAEVERVRATLERSARTADERLRALEVIIGAVSAAAAEIAPAPVDPVPPRVPERPVENSRTRPGPPVLTPDAPVRGGWAPPAGAE
jgi:hypothetical protein